MAARRNVREFLQLAQTFDPDNIKHLVAGLYASEKLDGTRCFWDGGISRGIRTEDVPWAGLIDFKTRERKKKIKPIATGLWSRYGNPIIAPDSFLNQLPRMFLDGELWAGWGNYQLNRSIVGGDTPDPRFQNKIDYAVYSTPQPHQIFRDGIIDQKNMVCDMSFEKCMAFIDKRKKQIPLKLWTIQEHATFEDELFELRGKLDVGRIYLHKQVKLSPDETQARATLEVMYQKVLDQGGEGVIIRNGHGIWQPKRVWDLLKYKPDKDAEGTLVGFTAGEEGKTGKMLGKIGALILDYKGKRLKLSGLTDEEREFDDAGGTDPALINWAHAHPGEDMLPCAQGKHFRTGQEITFLYRELTDDGIPKEARYHRRRDTE